MAAASNCGSSDLDSAGESWELMVQAAMKQCWHRLLFSAEPLRGSQLLGACSHKAHNRTIHTED